MRIGPFELDFLFQPGFTAAQVCSRQAHLLRTAHVRNVRGTSSDWLKITCEAAGRVLRRSSVRSLPVGDEEAAVRIQQKLQEAFVLPADLAPGTFTGRLLIDDESGRSEVPFSFEIYTPDVIPTDFARAVFLASHVSESDQLRSFASEALPEGPLSPQQTAEQLFLALCGRHLRYQPPVSTKYPDCQRVSPVSYVLSGGGSCADLSLLYASLLWVRGLSPVLLLFPEHMTAGLLVEDPDPQFETLDDAGVMVRMIEEGRLFVPELTDVCAGDAISAEASAARTAGKLRSGSAPCRLVNIRQVLRSGTAVSLREPAALRLICPTCGYPHIPADQPSGAVCPACGTPLPIAQKAAPGPAVQVKNAASNAVRYTVKGGLASAALLTDPAADVISIADTWQGTPVRSIAERALQNSRASRIFLPDVLTSIGDYAFYGCTRLQRIELPMHLKTLGTGAFCASGLCSVRIPGSVREISRMAFYGCSSLEEVQLQDGTEIIGERAFAGCRQLKAVRIPSSVRLIRREAFDQNCELWLLSPETVVER